MQTENGEVMLAQEQGTIMREAGFKKELEGSLGGEVEGTLILTNRRLIFVTTNEKEYDLRTSPIRPIMKRIFYSEVEDLDSIPTDPGNVFVPISSISSVTGHHAVPASPSLQVRWREGGEEKGRVFIEVVTGRSRRKNLNDWATVIDQLKKGTQKLIPLPKTPTADTLEGKIMRVQADMQWRGVLGLEEEVENNFNIKLEVDEVQASCDKLCGQGVLKQKLERGDQFYRKASPLGDNDLAD
jgi:hypothetical protein